MSDPTVVSPAPTNAQDETRSVVKAAGVIGVATFSSRILGFVRDMVLARTLWRDACGRCLLRRLSCPQLAS